MTRVYRLKVKYPPGSFEDGWQPAGWEPEAYQEAGTGAWVDEEFRWPRADRVYLSRSGAKKRADLLRSYGARIEIQRSEPIVWPESTEEAR